MKLLDSVQIELTNHCNYRCSFCPHAYYKNPDYEGAPFDRKKGNMDFETFKLSVKQCKKYAKRITFGFFGESTLHKDYFKYFQYLKKNKGNLEIMVTTNLSMVTKEMFDLWIDVGVTQVRFSIDAMSSGVYDIVRPGGPPKNLHGTLMNIGSRLDIIKDKVKYWFGLPQHCPTRHVFVLCKNNKEEAEEYVQFWSKYLGSKDEILIKNVLTYGGVINSTTPAFDELTFTNACNIWKQKLLTIAWNGDVSPCNLDVNMSLTVGNIKTQELNKLYLGEKYKEIRRLSINREISPCNTCHDANNWTNNIILTKNGKLGARWMERFSETKPKHLPKG